MSDRDRLPVWRTALFALPGAPLLALSVPPIVFLPPYYASTLGFDAAIVGAAFLFARVLDVFVNPTIGGLQDRTRSPFGRRRTWLIGATPVLMGFIWLAFIGLEPGAPAIALTLVIMGLYISFAAAMIAHLGWAGELSPDYHGRTRILGFVQIASALGQILMMATPAIVEASGLGDFNDGVRIMGLSALIALPICVLIAVLAAPEPPAAGHTAELGFLQSIRAVINNRLLRRVLAPDLLIGAAQGVAGTLFVFYATHVMGIRGNASALILIYFLSGLFAAPLWMALARRVGKHAALSASCAIWAIAFALLPLLPSGDFRIAVAGMAFAGISSAASTLLVRAMMADVVDDDELRTGRARAGLYYGLLLTTSKVGLAIGPATLVLLSAFGFDAREGAVNDPDALLALEMLFCGAPIVLLAATIWTLHGYPLTEEMQRAMRAQIDARRAQAPSPAE